MTSEGNEMVMPVTPMGGFGGNGGFGNWGSDVWIILLVLFAFGGFGGWGANGFGGGIGGYGNYDFPWLLASNANSQNSTQNGFDNLYTNNAISALQSAVTSGFGDTALGIAGINQNICQTGNAVVNAVNSGFNSAEVAANARQMANMQQAFTNQTAMNTGFTGLQAQLAQCCCDNRLATAQTQALVQSENCADRYEAVKNTQSIISAITSGIQSIKDDLCQDRLEAERRENANLRTQLSMAQLAASQDVQTATIQAGQRALANEVEQYVAPKPIPSYIVQNPNCCVGYNSCGCGSF